VFRICALHHRHLALTAGLAAAANSLDLDARARAASSRFVPSATSPWRPDGWKTTRRAPSRGDSNGTPASIGGLAGERLVSVIEMNIVPLSD